MIEFKLEWSDKTSGEGILKLRSLQKNDEELSRQEKRQKQKPLPPWLDAKKNK